MSKSGNHNYFISIKKKKIDYCNEDKSLGEKFDSNDGTLLFSDIFLFFRFEDIFM